MVVAGEIERMVTPREGVPHLPAEGVHSHPADGEDDDHVQLGCGGGQFQ